MSDDTRITEPHDKKRINIGQSYEVNYWKKKFGVSEDELVAAVNKVGTSVDEVEKYFKKN
ncbi:Protein of unknown function [Nitrosomonas eutropha]|uniref:DUF3606 domain-containing protein n=1 Tax=Nitrosomonas eutropha TaxID=916 RepID=A0A1I7JE09_9PROT|nr:DUF3606 domain-containing protein [Nitrosomonas eutropha]SFU83381.1 Protein of unknown function [Nitrosomonas eutropha]